MPNFPIEDWWTERQRKLVEDRSRTWRLQRFQPGDGFWITREGKRIQGKVSRHEHLPDDAIIEKGSWDHEHCFLCSAKLSLFPGDVEEGFTDGEEWLCLRCYESYIPPRLRT